MIAGLPGVGLSAMFYGVLLVGMGLARLARWLSTPFVSARDRDRQGASCPWPFAVPSHSDE